MLACLQMCSVDSVESNLAVVRRLVAQAAMNGATLILLPENFAFIGSDSGQFCSIAESHLDGPIQAAIQALAIQWKLWIVAGTIPIQEKGSDKLHAASMIFDADGQLVARYDKIHLFDVQVSDSESHNESDTFVAGQDVEVVDTPLGKVGLSVCYDLRFAEMYRTLARKGAEIFVVPAAFTATTGQAHWEILLRARAIENLCYVAAANQTGTHPGGRSTWGHSMMIDPWGKILQQVGKGENIILSAIDKSQQSALRRQFPCHEHHILERTL